MRTRSILLAVAALAVSSLAFGAAPSSAASIVTYVGCSPDGSAVPSHVCQIGDTPGAFFESDVETEYEVCVTFPGAETLCSEEEPAEAETLYVNEITTDLPGNHLVTWYLEGVEVASWSFRMDPVPLPPAPTPTPTPSPTASTPPSTAPATVTPPSSEPACLYAKQRVGKLKTRLRKARSPKSKARIRGQLRGAKNAAANACG